MGARRYRLGAWTILLALLGCGGDTVTDFDEGDAGGGGSASDATSGPSTSGQGGSSTITSTSSSGQGGGTTTSGQGGASTVTTSTGQGPTTTGTTSSGQGGGTTTVTTSSGTGGAPNQCPPGPGDSMCMVCAKQYCCAELIQCQTEMGCTCWLVCLDNGGDFSFCQSQCGQPSTTSYQLYQCTVNNCPGCP